MPGSRKIELFAASRAQIGSKIRKIFKRKRMRSHTRREEQKHDCRNESDSSFDLLVRLSCSLKLLVRCSCCSTHANSLALLHSACTKRMQHALPKRCKSVARLRRAFAFVMLV